MIECLAVRFSGAQRTLLLFCITKVILFFDSTNKYRINLTKILKNYLKCSKSERIKFIKKICTKNNQNVNYFRIFAVVKLFIVLV